MTVLIVLGCRQTPIRETAKLDTKAVSGTGNLIPIDFSDSNYLELRSYAVDRTTDDGWSIKYFVKEDSTRYKDLYIVCSKGSVKAIHRAEDVLKFRRYFVPEFEAETKANIFFSHGCATDCSAMLVFNKVPTARFTDYLSLVKYSIELGQVLYVTDSSYENEGKVYELALVDVSKHKTYKLTFNGVCDCVYQPACVDSVKFSKNTVSVTASLRKNIESDEQSKQTKTVLLPQ
jgi:hypothetical protein